MLTKDLIEVWCDPTPMPTDIEGYMCVTDPVDLALCLSLSTYG